MKLLFFASCFGIAISAHAQNEQNAILYSAIGAGGSARTLGMAGSFSAIGADPSAALINPAGIGMVRRNEFNFGLQFMNISNKATYLKTEVRDAKMNFNVPTMNLNFASVKYDSKGKPKKQGLANVSYGFNINRLANFHSRVSFDGENKQSSISDYFATQANNQDAEPFDLYLGSIASIAYSAGAIENLVDGGGFPSKYYASRYVDSNRNNQQVGSIESKGNIYEYQFSVGANFSHKIYLGIGLLYSSLRYSEELSILEIDKQSRNNPDVESMDFQSSYFDRGNGFGAKIGAIFRPNDQFRLAVAVHTPKTYTINEEYGYNLTTTFEPGANSQKEVNAYVDPLNTYKYKVSTPARYITAIGFVLNKLALINAELEFYDYTTARMKASGYAFTAENNNIRRMYQNVVIFRLGTELNFPDPNNSDAAYRLRFGYANSPSPFSSKVAGIDEVLKKAMSLITTGFGYRDKDYYLDFALTYGTSSSYYTPYVTGTNVFPVSSITNKRNSIGFAFTVGTNFD